MSDHSTLPAELVGYVPAVVARRLAVILSPIATPSAESRRGACAFVDIAGFTGMTERLARQGVGGAEAMADLLDTWFGSLIDLAASHGGEVVDFAGDALLIVWWDLGDGLAAAAGRAVTAAQAMQAVAAAMQQPDAQLQIKVTVTAGDLDVVFVGAAGHKRCLVSGDPVRAIAGLSDHAAPGDTVVSADVAAAVTAVVDLEVGPDEVVRVHGPGVGPPPIALPACTVPSAARAALEEFLPAALDRRFTPGRDPWLAEFRRVTSVFVRIVGLPPGAALAPRLGAVIEDVQAVVHRHEGTIHQLIDGDKGLVLLAAFGLPPHAHEDDADRGVQAALAVEEVIAEQGLRSAIGVSTGMAFFGPVGGEHRRDFALVGDRVNLAARLMQHAADDILCDEATAVAYDRIDYDALPAIAVKGKAAPVGVYRPQGDAPRLIRARATRTTLVGRTAEQAVLGSHLARLVEGIGGLVVIEGEAGIGKSRLVEDLLGRAANEGVRALVGTARPVEMSTPLFGWRSVIAAAVGLEDAPDNAGARRRHLLRWLGANLGADIDPSLLNDVLGVRLPGTGEDGVSPQDRATAVRALLGDLLAAAAVAGPLVVVLEDAHWLDPASWALTQALRERGLPVLLVVATRPLAEPVDAAVAVRSSADVIQLSALEAADSLRLVAESLGVDELPAAVRQLIAERASGHPFFSEELGRSLRDSGVLLIRDRVAELADEHGAALDDLAVPDTVQGVVRSRIDRLTPRQQLVLKTASVVGRTFDVDLVSEVFPVDDERQHVREELAALERRGLLAPSERQVPERSFAHAITRDVAYDAMPWAQRRNLHRRAAAAIERGSADAPAHVVLAHHWLQAAGPGEQDPDALDRAVHHLTAAGAASLRQGAFVEAERAYRDALDGYRRLPADRQDVRRELAILRPLGTTLYSTHGFGSAEAKEVHERAFALATNEVAGGELFPYLWGLWSTTHFSADAEAAIALGERLMAIADEVGDPQLQLQAHHALWTTLITIPDYPRASRHLAAGVALYQPGWHEHHCATYGGHDPGSCAHRALALTQWTTGLADQAVASGAEAIRLAREHEASAMNARLALAFVHHQRGDLDATAAEVAALVEIARSQDIPKWIDWAEVLGAWARGRQGDLDGAIAEIEEIRGRLGMADPGYLLMLGDLYLRAGTLGQGLELVDDLFAFVEDRGERSQEAELHRLRGELLLARHRGEADPDDRARGLACLEAGFATAQAQGAWAFALRAAVSQVRALAGDAGEAQAKERLRGVRGRLTEGAATADVRAADALLG